MMKKILGLVLLFGMGTALAGDVPEQVDIYRKEIHFEKSHVGELILFSGAGLVVGGLVSVFLDDPLSSNSTAKAASITAVGTGIGSLLGLLRYKYKKRWHQLRKDVPIVSLRSDGIWYEQKFICKWEDIRVIRRVGTSPDTYSLTLRNRWGGSLVTLDMELLDYSYHNLMNDLRAFGCGIRLYT